MKLSEFRTSVALISQRQLAELADLAESTVFQVESGKPFSKLTQGKILAGLSKHLGRSVSKDEIDEFQDSAAL